MLVFRSNVVLEQLAPLLDNWRIVFVFVLIVVALYFFTTERLPIEITALGVLSVLALSGILPVERAFSGFSNEATLTVLMMFILSGAVLQSGLVDWLGDRMGVLMGRSVLRQVAIVAIIVGPISAFINNTAAVAVMIPLLLRLANKAQQSPSRLLIPLSFAAMLGGLLTLIGTSTNLLASAVSHDLLGEGFEMFEFTKAGIIVFGVGVVYLSLTAGWLLRPRIAPRPMDEVYHLRDFLFEAIVAPKSALEGERVGAGRLTRDFGATVLQILRGGVVHVPEHRRLEYAPGDRLLLKSNKGDMQRMADTGFVTLLSPPEDKGVPFESLHYAELLVHATSRVADQRVRDIEFFKAHDVKPVALHRKGKLDPGGLGLQALRTGDIVLVCGAENAIEELTGGEDFRVQGGPETPLRRPHKIPQVLVILGLVVVLAAFEVFPIVVTATAGVFLMVATGSLRLREMYRSIHWNVIFLLAGIIPLGLAMQDTGAADLLGLLLARAGDFLPPVALLGLFYVLTTLLTNVISNNASIVLTAPIGVSLAQTLGYEPLTFILAAMFAASASFLTPVGYQTNLMVMTSGGYKYSDFFWIGAPLNIILAIITPLVLNFFWPVVPVA